MDTETNNQLHEKFDEFIKSQRETNKRLKDIDTTLDWFFWLMIIGIVGSVISLFL